MIKDILRQFTRQYRTLNLIEVEKKALVNNFRFFQKLHPEAKICPVLKSNAYGHGLKLVGKFVDQEIRPVFICVDSLYEAYELEKEKIKTPILIMGYTFPENFRIAKRLNFTFPVYDEETLAILNKYQPGAKIHIKVDTGMNRLGLPPGQIREFIRKLRDYKRITIEGVYSHLSMADDLTFAGKKFTGQQIKTFKEAIKLFEQEGINFKWKHIAATAGAMQIFDSEFNLIRLGLGFYGFSPFDDKTKPGKTLIKNLKPALKLSSHIVQIKEINEGDRVSYGGTFVASKKTKIGVLPIGYYDGIDRRLSNKGFARYKNTFCPIIGNICMNVIMIDVSGVGNPKVGDEVIIFEQSPFSPASIYQAAIAIETIPYTVLTDLSETTRRVLR